MYLFPLKLKKKIPIPIILKDLVFSLNSITSNNKGENIKPKILLSESPF